MSAERSGQPPSLMKIGEACDRVGLSLRTVRYYEEVGLLTPAARSSGGFRLYSEADVARLRILKGMKPLGLSLEEIRELMDLLDLAESPPTVDVGDVERASDRLRAYTAAADARVARLEQHLAEVQRLRDRIGRAVERLSAARA